MVYVLHFTNGSRHIGITKHLPPKGRSNISITENFLLMPNDPFARRKVYRDFAPLQSRFADVLLNGKFDPLQIAGLR